MVERLGQGSGALVALVVVVVLLVGIAGVGIVAAIAIPSLLRARVSANEATRSNAWPRPSAASRDIRRRRRTSSTRASRRRPAAASGFRFVAGPAAAAEAAPGARVSPSSLRAFAYVAEPVTPGQSGVRAFCAEASGIICSSGDGRIRDAGDGGCPVGCAPLE